jgi:hypothetical protein
MFIDAFNFALQESRLLEKAVFKIQPFGLAFGFYGAKVKSQTKHTLIEVDFLCVQNEVHENTSQTRLSWGHLLGGSRLI